MYTTPSDVYNINIDSSVGLDFMNFEDDHISMEQMIVDNVYPGNWKMCKVNEDSIILANETVFKEILNIETITNKLENNTTITCASMEEAMEIKNELMKAKSSMENSMEYMGTLECIHHQDIKSEFLRVTPNIAKPINLYKKDKEAMNNVVSSPYGIANIEKISKKSFLVKLFAEGTLFEVYNSFIGEVALIEFSRKRQEQTVFDIFSEMPKMIFHEE